ncbi:cutinase family protein [Candidatus Saccharibacteria bacterium]|nr:cutinase family protein [Candidatus Saccharibacteria bacterium]
MRFKLFAFIAASAVAFTVVCLPLATPTSASSCDDIKFIFARGSGQNLGAAEFSAWRSEIQRALNSYGIKIKSSFYELGMGIYGGARYPAVATEPLVALGAKISAGKSFAFGESVKQGETELKSYIKDVSTICKKTKFVLGGYSQGAMVVTNSIPYLDSEKVVYAATFGDPYLFLPEGRGLFPDACKGKNLSDYRVFAPNCYTNAGILGAKDPYEPAGWLGKIGLWCNDKDFMCGAGFSFSGEIRDGKLISSFINNALAAGHLNYVSDNHFRSAAKIIAQKISTRFVGNINLIKSPGSDKQDTAFLIDRTASMGRLIDLYKIEALRLAQETIKKGGRIALFTYGDLIDSNNPTYPDATSPKKLLDFTTDYAAFTSAINSISLFGGGDTPESTLSALVNVMDALNWRVGANKSIILLTDAGYHTPDRDGTTFEQVVAKSLAIDPVNIYVINTTDSAAEYTTLSEATGGKLFTSYDSFSSSTDYVLNRPDVNFPLASYFTQPGENIEFHAVSDSEIIRFDWDLDFDGHFETTTTTPNISTVYRSPQSGFVQVRATNSAGLSSTASAHISISSSISNFPEITNFSYTYGSGTAKLSYTLKTGTAAVIVSINGAMLGVTTEQNIEISDIDNRSTITLTPISVNGITGTPITIHLAEKETGGNSTTSPNIKTEAILAPKSGMR